MKVNVTIYNERNRLHPWRRELQVFDLPADMNGALVCRLVLSDGSYWHVKTQEEIDREWEKI